MKASKQSTFVVKTLKSLLIIHGSLIQKLAQTVLLENKIKNDKNSFSTESISLTLAWEAVSF